MAAHSRDYQNVSDADVLVYGDMILAQAGQVSNDYDQREVQLSSSIQSLSKSVPTSSLALTDALNNGLTQLRNALAGDGQVLLELENGDFAMAANDAVNTERYLNQAMTTINAGLSAVGVPTSVLQPAPSA